MERQLYFDRKIASRLESAERFRLNPGLYYDLFWRPCTVRILMVADSFLYFSDENFGLSDLISVLKNETHGYVQFEITVAHRGSPSNIRMGIGNPDIEKSITSFKFDESDDFDPEAFDQVWLFAAQRSDDDDNDGIWSNRLSDSELRVLTQFMDDGGGVFATGDHEDLGAAMGGFVPRVRQMRRWFFPNPGPNGEGVAPPFEGEGRFDTNREGHDAGYQFNDQSDDVPQTITPQMYQTRIGAFQEFSYPHPVLCGPNGPIKVLPDHAHESQCTHAANPNATETLDGKTFTEFPNATDGGSRPLPDVIATSTVIGGHLTSGKMGTTVARSFGAISAYDGHRASVGRVVCDATWHHFININLTGAHTMNNTSAPPISGNKGLGFLATPAGQAVYEEIKAYFVNIALWLSPAPKISCMRNWGLYLAIETEQLVEVFDPRITSSNARLIDYVILGRHARDAIGNFASQCQRLIWTWDLVLRENEFLPFIDLGDPWRPFEQDRERREDFKEIEDLKALDMVDMSWVADAALGGAILALREEAFPINQKLLDSFDEIGEEITRKGAQTALERALPFLQRSLEEMGERGKEVLRRRN